MASLWDPRSYLAEAASRQILTADTDTTATTIVNYYDSIASHLAAVTRNAKIHNAAQAVEDVCLLGGSVSDKQETVEEKGGEKADVKCFEIKESSTSHTGGIVSGVAMNVPFKVLFSTAYQGTEKDSVHHSEDVEAIGRVAQQFATTIVESSLKLGFERSFKLFSFDKDSEMMKISYATGTSDNKQSQSEAEENKDLEKTQREVIVPISVAMAEVLQFAKWLHEISNGKYDPTLGEVSSIFKSALRRHGSRPGETEHWKTFDDPSKPGCRDPNIRKYFYDASEAAGFDNIELFQDYSLMSSSTVAGGSANGSGNGSPYFVKKLHQDTRLDLCAITKGWTVDLITKLILHQLLDDNNDNHQSNHFAAVISGVSVEWGGDSSFWGGIPSSRLASAAGLTNDDNVQQQAEEEEDEEDVAASTLRPWRVAIEQPPKLKLLFDAWKDGKANEYEKNYQHLLEIPMSVDEGTTTSSSSSSSKSVSYTAVATSGDYSQLERFGYFHMMDAKKKVPLKVFNHTVSSATILSQNSCMLADGLATVLMITRNMTECIDTIIDVRARENARHGGGSSAGGAAEALTNHNLGEGASLLRYYLFERNHSLFVHDEDDTYIGEGDHMRKRATDKKINQREAYDQVDHVTTGRAGSNQNNSDDDKRQGGQDDADSGIPSQLKKLMRRQPYEAVVATVPTSTSAFEAMMMGGALSSSNQNQQGLHAALLSSVVTLPDEMVNEQGTSEVYREALKLKALTSMLQTQQPEQQLSDDGGISTPAQHHQDPSTNEVTPATSPSSPPKRVFFNVMRGSILHNFVACVGNYLCLNFLTTSPEDQETYQLMREGGIGSWIADHGRGCDVVDLTPAEERMHRAVVTCESLVHCAVVVRVRFVTAIGDHLLVVAETNGESAPSTTAVDAFNPGGTDNHHHHQLTPGLTPLNTERLLTQSWNTIGGGDDSYFCPPTLWTPSLVIAPHTEYGRIGFPILGLRMCSVSPPLMSFVALCSEATQGMVTGKIPGRSLTIHLLSGTSTSNNNADAHNGNGGSTRDGIPSATPPFDCFSAGHGEQHPTASYERYRYLPFPVFKNPSVDGEVPGAAVTATLKTVVVKTMTIRRGIQPGQHQQSNSSSSSLVTEDAYDRQADWNEDGGDDVIVGVVAVTGVEDVVKHSPLLGLLGGEQLVPEV